MNKSVCALALAALLFVPASRASASCNLIPSATQTFRSSLGAVNKPYAAPGDFVEVSVRPSGCDFASPGFGVAPENHIVTIVYTPPDSGTRRVVFLTDQDGDCDNDVLTQQQQGSCEAIVGPGNVDCVDGPEAALELVTREGLQHLSFRFPDSTALLASGLAGPATIAVTDAASPSLPCGLATKSCATQAGTIACVDNIFTADGTCQPHPRATFSHFTALPAQNDYQASCFADAPPCNPTEGEVQFAVDMDGNLLVPVNWAGILVRQGGIPVPRLLRATIHSPVPLNGQPPTAAFGSFTPEGAPLPPIFEPQSDPNVASANTLSLFGTADAAYTILRLARRAGVCVGGNNDGADCVIDTDCASNVCENTCVGGASPPGTVCTKASDCAGGGRCGEHFDDFRPLAVSGAPLSFVRDSGAICQLDPHDECTIDAQCAGLGDPCVSYALEARTPIPLEGLAGSDDMFAFSVSESIALQQLNADADQSDLVLTLQNRDTGRSLPIGAGGALGRAITAIREIPFRFPALASEGDLVAFLEAEALEATSPAQGDDNGDGDSFDTILRVYERSLDGESATELTDDLDPIAADAALMVSGRSLAVSGGNVFFRTPEWSSAPETTVRVSLTDTGGEGDNASFLDNWNGPQVSATGRFVVFRSSALNLITGGNSAGQLFVHDRDFDEDGIFDEPGAGQTTDRVSETMGGAEGNGAQGGISADGRFVVFTTSSATLVPGFVFACPQGPVPLAGCANVVLKDRQTGAVEVISQDGLGTAGNGDSERPSITADGRFIVFESQASNLVVGDNNFVCDNQGDAVPDQSCRDIFVYDRCVANGDPVPSCAATMDLVSLDENDQQITAAASYSAISDDGRVVSFNTADSLVSIDLAGDDVYVRDREAGTTILASENIAFNNSAGGLLSTVSGDGRSVSFQSNTAIIPNSSLSGSTAYVRDLETLAFDVVSQSTEGAATNHQNAAGPFSSDGRFVLFNSQANNLQPGSTLVCRGGPNPDCPNLYVRDRASGLSRRVSVADDGSEMDGETTLGSMSGDARTVAFNADADNLIGPGNDTNLCDVDMNPGLDPCYDVFVRTIDWSQAATADRSGDGIFDDTILEVMDDTGTRTPLCPAGEVVVADGRAAFLRPEVGGAVTAPALPDCPLGTPASGGVDLDGDTLATGEVVQLWPGSGAVQNLAQSATAIAISSAHVAAISDGTVQTYPVGGGSWTDSSANADSIQFCGAVVAFTQAVGNHHELGLYDPTDDVVILTGQAVEEVVCSSTLVAFRTPESVEGDINFDGDSFDDVLQTWTIDPQTRPECTAPSPPFDCLGNSEQAIIPCRIDACDPRIPYRVGTDSVKFLTYECDQGGVDPLPGCPGNAVDLNEDGDDDVVIQVYDTVANVVRYFGTPAQQSASDPLHGGELDDTSNSNSNTGGGSLYESVGRCVESIATACSTNVECDSAEVCRGGGCKREHSVCLTNTDCTPGIACETSTNADAGIVAASPDSDLDGIPDHIDNCVYVANGEQLDGDLDSVGDLCDLATCGNDDAEFDEECDGTDDAGCSAVCLVSCTCDECGIQIADPKRKISVKAKNEAGGLTVKFEFSLPDYDGEPVVVRLEDTDSDPIVRQAVGAIPALGTSGKKWQFRTKAVGIQKVQIKKGSTPGVYKIGVRAKKWFATADANDSAANTRLTVTVGTHCFTSAVTKKSD